MVLAAFFACLHTGDTGHAMGIAGFFLHFAEGNKGNTMVLVTFFLLLHMEMCLNTLVLQAFSCNFIGGHRKYNGIGRLFLHACTQDTQEMQWVLLVSSYI